MDYQVKRDDGKLISYKLIGYSVIPVEVNMYEDGLNTVDFMNIIKVIDNKYSHFCNKDSHFCIMG